MMPMKEDWGINYLLLWSILFIMLTMAYALSVTYVASDVVCALSIIFLVILVILFPNFKRKNEENVYETGGETDELQE